jgi:hypothetical protein
MIATPIRLALKRIKKGDTFTIGCPIISANKLDMKIPICVAQKIALERILAELPVEVNSVKYVRIWNPEKEQQDFQNVWPISDNHMFNFITIDFI